MDANSFSRYFTFSTNFPAKKLIAMMIKVGKSIEKGLFNIPAAFKIRYTTTLPNPIQAKTSQNLLRFIFIIKLNLLINFFLNFAETPEAFRKIK